MKILQIILFVFLLTSTHSCNGQEKNNATRDSPTQSAEPKEEQRDFDPYFNESNAINEAPKSITRNLVQDNDGNIWFASWEGIFSYDGTDFTNHTNLEGLRRHRGFSTLEDSMGNIWIGTIGAGVYKYDKEAVNVGRSPWRNLSTKEGLVNDDVGCLFEDSKGNIWMGTRVGVSCYDGKTFKNYTVNDGLVDNDINGIIEDEFGKIWFAARGEACYYDGKEFTKITTKEGMSFTNARSIIRDSKGNIWLGGNDGLWRYDGQSYKKYKSNFIGNIYEDSKGSIWVVESDPDNNYSMTLQIYGAHDLFAKEPKSKEVVSGNGQIFGIIEDREGNIWFGHERGVCKYDGETFEYFLK